MATTHTVVWGDTLSALAIKYSTTVDKLVELNDIEDPDFIVVEQVLIVSGTTTKTTNKTSKAIIKAFGLQTGTDRAVYASWKWDKANTDKYQVKWYYATGDGLWFVGEDSTVTAKQSLYSAPSNATRVRFFVKPISKKKTVNGKETSYWTATWSTERIYPFSDNPPTTPSVPTVAIDKYTLTASLDNIDLNATEIEFKIYKIANNQYTAFKTGKATIKNKHAAFSCTVSAGYEYTASCRAIRGKLTSGWSDYQTSLVGTPPSAPSRITTCEAASSTSIRVKWPAVSNAGNSEGKKYELQYVTEDKRYFDLTENQATTITCDTNESIVLDLSTGKEYFFRVRAINGKGESDWTSVVSTILGTGPAAPTTWSSATSVTVGEPLYLYWIHNSEDGSNQTAAQIELINPDGEFEKVTVTISDSDEEDDDSTDNSAESYTVQTSNYTDGAKFYWRVRTQGIVNDHSWGAKDWGDAMRKFTSTHLWTDGTYIYYSYHTDTLDSHYVLQNGNWVTKEWGTLYPWDGDDVWTDGTNTYYSYSDEANGVKRHYVLKDGVWENMTWSGYTNFTGSYIWNKGAETYYSNSSKQYVLGENNTWEAVSWSGLTSFEGKYVWSDDTNYYYSFNETQYYITKTSTDRVWTAKQWTGLSSFIGNYIWKDNLGIYHYSNGDEQYKLNGSTWESESWLGLTSSLDGRCIWLDADNVYYSNSETQKVMVEDYGKWSVQRLVNIYAEPQVTLTVTDSNETAINELGAYPFYITATPEGGTQIPLSYHVSIIYDPEEEDESYYETSDDVGNLITVNKGQEVYSKYYDKSDVPLLLEISAGSVRLENNKRYTLVCTVGMDSGLTAENSVSFTVKWNDENYANEYEPNAEIILDEEKFATYIRPYCEDDSETPIDNILLDVFRCNSDGSFTAINDAPIASGKNEFIPDPHPALNYARYRVVATSTTTGTVTYCDIPNYPIGGKSVVIQWDEQWAPFDTDNTDAMDRSSWTGSMLILPYNIDISDNPTPDVSLVEYIGRKHPVSYYGTQLGETSSWSVAIPKSDTETLYGIRRLAVWQGDVYVREPSGSGYWANIRVSYSQTHGEPIIPVTFDVTRVEGGV